MEHVRHHARRPARHRHSQRQEGDRQPTLTRLHQRRPAGGRNHPRPALPPRRPHLRQLPQHCPDARAETGPCIQCHMAASCRAGWQLHCARRGPHGLQRRHRQKCEMACALAEHRPERGHRLRRTHLRHLARAHHEGHRDRRRHPRNVLRRQDWKGTVAAHHSRHAGNRLLQPIQ